MLYNLLTALSDTDLTSASDAIAESALDFKFEPDNFLQALPTIVSFTLSIFVVMLVIILVTALLNAVTSGKKAKKEDDAE